MTRTKPRYAAGPRKDPATDTWWFVVDAGSAPVQRCPGCRHRVWLQSARELTVCPKCAQPLRPPVFERRQAKRRGFPTKKAAQVEFDRLKVSVHDATFVATQATTVGEYLLVWVESQAAAGLKPGTVSSYRDQIRLHVLPHLGPKPLQKLGPLDLDKLYAHLLVAGRKNGPGGLSNRTVRYIHTIVGSALKDAVAKGLVIRNVAKLASPPSVKSTRPEEVETWTHQELALFLGATADHDLATLFRTAAMTGLRRGELLGLRWSDLDLTRNLLRVKQQVVAIDGRSTIASVKTNASRRTVTLDERTVAILRSHRARQARDRLAIGSRHDLDLVFTNIDGRWIEPQFVSARFEVAVAAIDGLKRIRWHDLRHTHATLLLASGTDPKTVSARLGHTSVAFTLDRYTHVLPTMQTDAARAMAAMVDG
jgi:integrase